MTKERSAFPPRQLRLVNGRIEAMQVGLHRVRMIADESEEAGYSPADSKPRYTSTKAARLSFDFELRPVPPVISTIDGR